MPTEPQEWHDRMRRLNVLRQAMRYAREEAQDKQARYYNLRHRKLEFNEGQLVLKKSRPLSNAAKNFCAKFAALYDGPYVITKKISAVSYLLARLSGEDVGLVSIHDLKPWLAPEEL